VRDAISRIGLKQVRLTCSCLENKPLEPSLDLKRRQSPVDGNPEDDIRTVQHNASVDTPRIEKLPYRGGSVSQHRNGCAALTSEGKVGKADLHWRRGLGIPDPEPDIAAIGR
jgi:hypothetical protein